MYNKVKRRFTSKEDFFLLTILFSIPLYFVLDANNQFPGLIPTHGSLQILGYAVMGAFLSFFLLILFVSIQKAVVLLSVYLLWYLYFKTIQVKVSSIQIFSAIKNLGYYLALSIIIIALITIVVCYLKKKTAYKLSKYLNLLFAILLLTEIGRVCFRLIREKPQYQVTNGVQFKLETPKTKADIYLIVMDGYAGIQSLQSNFGYNNYEFVSKLRKDSFFVADAPNSNYNSTLFSLSSMFNMNYSNSFVEKDLKGISAFGKAAKEIQSNSLVPFLISNGYEIKNYSGFRIKDIPSDVFNFMAIENRLALEKTFGNVMRNQLFTRLPSNSLQNFLGTYFAQVDQYNQRVYAQCLKDFSQKNKNTPEFVYAHLFMPHDPLLNRKDGTLRNYAEAFYDGRNGKFAKSYVEYLQFANNRVSHLLDLIMKRKGEKIVLLVSDHGERFIQGKMKGSPYNNFFAVYNSKKNYTGFNDTFPLINTFRVVLNTYFHQQLPMLDNKKLNVHTGREESF